MQKGLKFSSVVAYFKKMAKEHVKLKHTETEKHFIRLDFDELMTGLNSSKLRFPILVMEGYKIGFSDQKSDNIKKRRMGAFCLFDKVSDRGDYDRIHAVWDELEAIGDDILVRMKSDKRDPNSPVENFDMNDVDAMLISDEIGQLIGIRYTFVLESYFPSDKDETRWLTQ